MKKEKITIGYERVLWYDGKDKKHHDKKDHDKDKKDHDKKDWPSYGDESDGDESDGSADLAAPLPVPGVSVGAVDPVEVADAALASGDLREKPDK
ncbi:hypothetical protein MXD62_24020, partial [Frankia sp. Mgl5]